MSRKKVTGARFTLSKLLILIAVTCAFIGIPGFCLAISPEMFWAGLFVSYAITMIAAIAIPLSCLMTFVILVTPESSMDLYWSNLKKAFKLNLISLLLLMPLLSYGLHSVVSAQRGADSSIYHFNSAQDD